MEVPAVADVLAPEVPLEEQTLVASEPYIGKWNRLVSTTNWEKGRIICQWREVLEASGAPVTAYSDETWSRLVGGVTGQHVGRLRRIYQRFGEKQSQYAGLYWSHFFAAGDWDDAEMWLEGAVQNRWSVSQMRAQRWETLGQVAGEQPTDDVVVADRDEDLTASSAREALAPNVNNEYADAPGPRHEGPDFGDDDGATARGDGASYVSAVDGEGTAVDLVRPFADLPALPDDLSEALDHFKLALLRHKTAGWEEVSRDVALQTLDALRALVLAPSADALA
jgi:hypothetical protein